jgi:predicted metal-dependent phosphoesterase TrpH
LAVLAHPFRYWLPAEVLVPAAAALGIDGLEVYYAYKNPEPWSPSPEETAIGEELAQTYGLLKTCGTDSHGSSILRRI